MFVTTDAINAILLEVVQITTAFVREREDEFIEIVRASSSLQQDETIKSYNRKILKNERRIAELDKMFLSLYQDKVRGIITEERFIQMSKIYEQERKEEDRLARVRGYKRKYNRKKAVEVAAQTETAAISEAASKIPNPDDETTPPARNPATTVAIKTEWIAER